MILFSTNRPPPTPTLFPYPTLFRSSRQSARKRSHCCREREAGNGTGRIGSPDDQTIWAVPLLVILATRAVRSEEHTSELQSHHDLVCRLLLENNKYASLLMPPSYRT